MLKRNIYKFKFFLEDLLEQFEFKFLFYLKNRKKLIQQVAKPIINIEILSKRNRKKVDLAICAIFYNEKDIIEWIEYHKLIGVDRFYLYDNGSKKAYKKLLEPYIMDGTVVYHYAVGEKMQMPAYNDAIYRYKKEAKWLAFIDLDEFIVPIKESNIKNILKKYEKYPAVTVCWVNFDSNGLDKRSKDKLVIEAYTRVKKGYDHPDNVEHIKSIVRTNDVQYCNNPHRCIYKKNKRAVNTSFEYEPKTEKYLQKVEKLDVMQINHYIVKSKEDYIYKISRGRADNGKIRSSEELPLNFKEYTYDYKIQKYLPELKDIMKCKRIDFEQL